MYDYLLMTIFLSLIWFFLFYKLKAQRKELVWMSLFGAPAGLLEPFFVPEYWHPQVLFDLNTKIGFDIESIFFSFFIAGIASVGYNLFIKYGYEQKINKNDNVFLYWTNRIILFIPLFILILLFLFSDLNPIYITFITQIIMLSLLLIMRKDLFGLIMKGSLIFTLFYLFICLLSFFIFPEFIQAWNIKSLSGILLFSVPIEEVLWAFMFATFATSAYKYIFWIKVKNN